MGSSRALSYLTYVVAYVKVYAAMIQVCTVL